jgi:hypothetical protein
MYRHLEVSKFFSKKISKNHWIGNKFFTIIENFTPKKNGDHEVSVGLGKEKIVAQKWLSKFSVDY